VATGSGALGLNGPVFTATDSGGHRAAQSQAQAAGARPGVKMRVLPRHIRLQDACSIDLTYAEEELGQECLFPRGRSAFRLRDLGEPPSAPLFLTAPL
jgi:hypothetical protein